MPPDIRFNGRSAQNSISAGAPPPTRWGNLQRSPDPLAVFKGPTSKVRAKEEGGESNGKGRGREEEGK